MNLPACFLLAAARDTWAETRPYPDFPVLLSFAALACVPLPWLPHHPATLSDSQPPAAAQTGGFPSNSAYNSEQRKEVSSTRLPNPTGSLLYLVMSWLVFVTWVRGILNSGTARIGLVCGYTCGLILAC